MDKIKISRYVSPCGRLLLGDWKGKLCLCDWEMAKHRTRVDRRIADFLGAEMEEGNSDLIEETKKQLREYFRKERRTIDVPTILCGTEFQRSVWVRLSTIPYGMTCSYGTLAGELGNSAASRAVANAVGANPLVIILPCHRIVGVAGNEGGYSGGLEAKRYLLTLENH